MTDSDALLGRTFGGRFLLVARLGEGGMGTVFRAVQQGGARTEVAVKVLRADLADDPACRARFEREMVMAAQIDHPNAVRFLEAGVEDGVPFFAMELVQGRELFDVLAVERRLSEVRGATIALQICDAVATAHDRGIVHRDLKPENVMLTGDPTSAAGERVKLLDFGIAKQIGQLGLEAGRITVIGAIVGTPTYMAPEQSQGKPVDARSDVYACGALLYHLVTGRPPFEDESPMKTLYRHVHELPCPPRQLVPSLSPELEAIILKALAKRPEDRQQGAGELWEELLAILPTLWARSGQVRVPLTRAPIALHRRAPTWALPAATTADGGWQGSRPAGGPARGSDTAGARVRRSRGRLPLWTALVAAAGAAIALLGWAESRGTFPEQGAVSTTAPATLLGP